MAKTPPSIYLSAPLFSQVERRWNRELALELEHQLPGFKVILPQDFRVEGKYNAPETYPALFKRCRASLEKSAAVVAILDGSDADSGVAFEVGVAHALGRPVVGVRTDYRNGQDKGVNLMLAQACAAVVREYSFNEDCSQLALALARRLQKLLCAKAVEPGKTAEAE